jgi:hypothetical protein
MQIVLEIDKRIDAARRLLTLEELHLERVRSEGLDDGRALDLVISQRQHLHRLLAQRARVIAHKGVPHPGLRRPPPADIRQSAH